MNTLRNRLAHPADSEKRRSAVEAVRESLRTNSPLGALPGQDCEPHRLALAAMAGCLGFLGEFEAEVERFKGLVTAMDAAVNPHRVRKED